MNNKNYLIYGISLLFLILLIGFVYFTGRNNGINSQKNADIKTELKTLIIKEKVTQKQIDSIKALQPKIQQEKQDFIKQETIIKEKIIRIPIEKPKDTVCNDLYFKATAKIDLLNSQISIKDSVENRSNKIINNQSLVIDKQEIIIKNKDQQIDLINNKKSINKRFGLGVNIGYGFSVSKDRIELKPYVGVGISYNFANF